MIIYFIFVIISCRLARSSVFTPKKGILATECGFATGKVCRSDATTAAVDAHVAVGGLELLLEDLVGADGVGLVLEADGGGGRGEEAKREGASIASGAKRNVLVLDRTDCEHLMLMGWDKVVVGVPKRCRVGAGRKCGELRSEEMGEAWWRGWDGLAYRRPTAIVYFRYIEYGKRRIGFGTER